MINREVHQVSNGTLPSERRYRNQDEPELPYMAKSAIIAKNVQITGIKNFAKIVELFEDGKDT